MSVKAALVLGIFLLLAALVHGGIYTTGHDFVANRFTGRYEFVPADDVDESSMPTRAHMHGAALTSSRPGARFVCLQRRR